MKFKFHPQGIGNLLLLMLFVFLFFHLLILLGIVDPSFFWDSTITNANSVWVSESIVIFFVFIFMGSIQAKLGRFPFRVSHKNADTFLWLMLLYVILNLIGAFLSGNGSRKIVSLIVTIIFVYLILRLIFVPNRLLKSRHN